MMVSLCFFPFFQIPCLYRIIVQVHPLRDDFYGLCMAKFTGKNNLCLLIKLIPKHPGIQVSTPLKQLNNLSIYYYAFFLLRLLLGPCILGFVALGILGNSGPPHIISSLSPSPAQPSPAQPSPAQPSPALSLFLCFFV